MPWWHRYGAWAEDAFAGRCYAGANNGMGVDVTPAKHYANSGTGAVALAAHFGAEKIIVVGADCQYADDGKRHCHGDHPAGLGNAGSVNEWPGRYARCAKDHKKTNIINASRQTILTCWPRQPLEQALAEAMDT